MMKILNSLAELGAEKSPVCLAAGFFDGVHRGHRKVLQLTMDRARQSGAMPWVLTFDSHPATLVRPGEAPLLLTSTEHKLRLLDELGMHGCLLLQFTPELANREPADFTRLLCKSVPSLREIIVGKNWRFGRNAAGNVALLAALLSESDVRVTVVEPALWKNDVISSSRIRAAVLGGDIDAAANMLGRPYSVTGKVARGRGIGRKLGYPTANIVPSNEVIPPRGVYAARAVLRDGKHDGVVNIGTRPTFEAQDDGTVHLELHIPAIQADLYGQDVEVSFIRKLRDERKFGSEDELREQIARDVAAALAACGRNRREN